MPHPGTIVSTITDTITGTIIPRERLGSVMKKFFLIVLALLVLGAAAGAAWWKFGRRPNPMDAGRRMQQAGDFRGAALELRAAVRAQPSDSEAHLRLGTVLLQLGDAVAAEKELRTAQSLGSPAPDLHVLLAQSYLLEGRNKELLAEFQPPEKTADLTAQLLMVRALAASSTGDQVAALSALATAEQVSPNSASVPMTTARIAMTQNNLVLASEQVERALLIDPKRPDGLLLKAQILRARGNRTGARAALDDAINLAPRYGLARLERASLLLELGQDAKAKDDTDEVLKAQPNSAAGTYLRAVLLTRAGDNAGAELVFQKLSGVIDRFPRANFFQAMVKLNLGQFEQALDMAQRYVAHAPADPDGVKLLARIQLAAKRPDRAIEAITAAARSGIADSELFDLLAQAYTASGRPADAVQSLNKATAIAPQTTQGLAYLASAKLGDLGNPSTLQDMRAETQPAPLYNDSAQAAVVTALASGDVEQAALALKEMRAEQGNTEAVGLLNGALLTMRQEYDGARKQFEDLIAGNPAAIRPRIGLAKLQEIMGQPEDAERTLTGVLTKDPANEASLGAVLPMLLSSARTERAVSVLETAAAAAPGNQKIALALADLYIRGGAPEKALHLLDILPTKADGPTAQQLLIRAHALAALHRQNDAIEVYTQLLLKVPGDVGVVNELASLQSEAKNWQAARATLRDALQTRPGDERLLRLLVGVDLAEGGEAAAMASINRLKAAPATRDAARTLTADFYLYTRRFFEAAEAYEALYRETPNSELAHSAADAYLKAGQTIPATSLLNDWLTKAPDDPAALRMMSDLQLTAGHQAEATATLEHLLGLTPADAVAMNNLAWIYAARNDPRALGYARRAFLLMPSPQSTDTLGWVLEQRGEGAAALPLLTQAAAALKSDPSVQYHYALALKMNGRNKDALAVAQPLADQPTPFPEQEAIRQMVKELRTLP
jgi:putative PEP-CTERM system TPR-repeat lipoprotein